MLLSIVIVNWNLQEELAACLDSLSAQNYSDLEIIVVDNDSHDGSAELVSERYPGCKLLKQTENLGFAEGCNRGILASTGAWVVTLNNDAVAAPGWANALARAAESAPADVGMLQCLMLFKQRPDVINSSGIELKKNGGGSDRQEGMPREANPEETEIFCCCAGAAVYRREMLEQTKLSNGYFDRTHFMYSEDLDLGWRARLAGWSARYVPQAVVFHRYHGSSGRHGRSWLVTMGRSNRIRTLLKNASWSLVLSISWNLLGAGLELLWHAKLRGPTVLFNAVKTGLAGRKEVSAMSTRSRRSVEQQWLGVHAR